MKIGVMFVVGFGFVLLLLSGVWPILFPAANSWSDAKSERLAQVKSRMNEVSHLLLRPNASKGVLQPELDQLTAENDQLNTEFHSAHDRPQTMSKFMKWSGISLMLVGIAGWYAVSQSR
jgi:hypothetical protein